MVDKDNKCFLFIMLYRKPKRKLELLKEILNKVSIRKYFSNRNNLKETKHNNTKTLVNKNDKLKSVGWALSDGRLLECALSH